MLKNYKKEKCYIIAEIGGNFTNWEQAKKLVDEAKTAGVDAVKLQTFKAATHVSKKAMFNMENTGFTSQLDLIKKLEIDEVLHKQIFDYIDSKGLDWFSTPSHESDVEILEKLNVAAYKIGSDDAVNIPFLKFIAKIGKPIILATGMCTMEEVRESVNSILEEGNDKIILLHAVTSYPAHPESVNLLAMRSMTNEFPLLEIGYSDHTIGTTACICAATLGARVLEKHFTYDKKAEGPDHMVSADPGEMKEIVEKVREWEIIRGNGIKHPANSERLTRINNRKSIVARRPLKKNQVISKDDIAIKRPGYGIQPRYFDQVTGRIVNRDIEEDEVLQWEYM